MRNTHITFLLLATMLIGACGRQEPPQQPQTGPAPVEASATFVGSGACRDCHEAEHRDWAGSHHERAMQIATTDTVLGDFDDASFEYYGTTTRFYRRDDDYFVQTADAGGQDREFRIAYTFGVEPLQQYLIEFDGGRLQALAFSWDTRPGSEGGQRWFHQYPDEYIAPDDSLHWTGRQQNWNYMCAECHSTNVDMAYDAASDTFATTWSEISVGCEGCHGPGSAHVQQAGAGSMQSDYGLQVDLDDQADAVWVMSAETGIAERSEPRMRPPQQPEACGRCHSRRGIIAPDYEYGEPLAHTHMPALLDESLYYADGQILDEVYVYGSFLQSRMYRAGVSCTDCHDPHSARLVTGANPNDVCAQCHMPTTFSTEEHAGHAADQAGCVDCHMGARTYMVVDDRRDHSFRIPRPDLTAAIETPNTCNGCHGDRDAAWAVAAIDGWRKTEAEPEPHFGEALAAGRQGYANEQLLGVVNGPGYPAIARASAVTLLAQPFGSAEFRTLQAKLGDADALVRIAALRQLRSLPPELRLRLNGAVLLADPVRGVRIEAVSTYAGMRDLLPIEDARAYAQAERDLRDAYTAIANRPEALVSLATFEAAEGNIPAAIGLYEQALRLEPRAVTARVNLADTLRGTGDEVRAEALLREGLALDDANPALHHALGLSLVRSRRPEAALSELRSAAALAPENPRYAYVLGIALNSLAGPAEALEVLSEAHSTFPTDFDISMALATVRRDAGDIEAALDVAYELARRHPEEPAVLGLLRSLGAVP
jgi:tetratricopeptide (TPR) repeat protein